MSKTHLKYSAAIVLASFLVVTGASAADSAGEPGRSSGKPNPLKNFYFGEQHLHTANSPDAFAMATATHRAMPSAFARERPSKRS